MSTTRPSQDVSGNGSGEVTRLRADILQTRAELGRTVEALAAKADVRARVRESTDQAKARVRESARDVAYHPAAWAVLFGGAAAVVLLIVIKRWPR